MANSSYNCGEYENICTFFAACEHFLIHIIIIMHSLTLACTHTVCPALTLTNGVVSYSDVGSGVERDVGSVATHTCNLGYRLEFNNTQAVGSTQYYWLGWSRFHVW